MFFDSTQRLRRQQAAAIKQLGPCIYPDNNEIGFSDAQKHSSWTKKAGAGPAWDWQVVQLSSRRAGCDTSHSQGKFGQAVLSLPDIVGADISISLPPALSITATHSGHIDCRLQLLGLTAEWPALRQQLQQRQQQPQLLHARSSATGFAVRCGGLLLAHALFPEHTNQWLACLAVPVAVADGLAAVSTAVPAAAKQAVRQRASRVKHKLQGTCRATARSACSGADDSSDAVAGWIDVSAGLLVGAMHTLRSLSGPAAAIAAGGWLWSVLHPSSHTLCTCLVALMAVSADYQQLGNEIARGKYRSGKSVERLWHARHKAAAQRLAPYLGDLPHTPPLQPIMTLARCCSIAAGVAVDGQHLSGAFADSSGHNSCSTHTSQQHQHQHQHQQRLLVCGSYQPQAADSSASKSHKAVGLSRSQLLELFTGTAEKPAGCSPAADAAAAVVAGALDAQQNPPCCAGIAPHKQQQVLTCSSPVQGSSRCVDLQPQRQGLGSIAVEVTGMSPLEDVDAAIVVSCCLSDSLGSTTPNPEPNDGVYHGRASAPPTTAAVARAVGDPTSSCSLIDSGSNGCGTSVSGSTGDTVITSSSSDRSMAFLDSLPLYGQQDHAGSLSAAAAANVGVRDRARLCLRGLYLLLVFTPFLMLGVPMLLLAWHLTAKAQQQQQQKGITAEQQQEQVSSSSRSRVSSHGSEAAVESPGLLTFVSDHTVSSKHTRKLLPKFSTAAAAAWQQLKQPTVLLLHLLKQFRTLLSMLSAVLDLLVVLLLGGRWSSGADAWVSAGLWLRQRAWRLLLLSCRRAGAAFIKWGQWSASRRDIFPEDFCDILAQLHDRAPVHGFRHTQREVEGSFGVPINQLFDSFDTQPLASGSVAQVHRARLRSSRVTAVLEQQRNSNSRGPSSCSSCSTNMPDEPVTEVVVKVCHPRVAYHIAQDFRLLSALSAAAVWLPALRGVSSTIRESVSQFSHTMTAQTDLRVEATHALRFHNNFKGVKSSVSIPRPIPGLVSPTVLVETFEPGRSVAAYMKETSAINTQIVGLGVDAFLKMLLVDNFVHTDLHPGNILFRAVPVQYGAQRQQQHVQQHSSKGVLGQQQQEQQQEQQPRRWWHLWQRSSSSSSNFSDGNGPSTTAAGAAPSADGESAAADGCCAAPAAEQWARDLQQLAEQQQQQWTRKHGSNRHITASPGTGLHAQLANEHHQPSNSSGSTQQDSSTGGPQTESTAVSAQLVLLDFGLAEELTPEVRHHFISFLMSIAAGDGLAAARHLLRWSHNQTCPNRSAFTADIVDLFQEECNIQRDAGIDLDAVMKAVLGLARQHHVGVDSCYASLVISVCVLVGFAKALDPGVNLMDAATPTLLAYAMTGAVVGRLYST